MVDAHNLQTLDCAYHPVDISSTWYVMNNVTNVTEESSSFSSSTLSIFNSTEELGDIDLDELFPSVDLSFTCADGTDDESAGSTPVAAGMLASSYVAFVFVSLVICLPY